MTDRTRRFEDAFEWKLKVARNVLIECLERRDVKNAHALLLAGRAPDMVESRKEGRQRLTRSRGSDNQRVLARRNRGPAEPLSGRRLTKLLDEPRRDRRVEPM